MNHFFPIEERTPEDNLCEPKKNGERKKWIEQITFFCYLWNLKMKNVNKKIIK